MSTLVAVVFDDETTAFEMRTALLKMQGEYLIELEDSVVVTKNKQGKTKLLLGALLGASTGAVSGYFSDIGLNDQMMKDLAQSFKPGTSALFVLVRKSTPDKVLTGLKEFAGKGKVFKSSLNKDDEATLRKALEKHSVAA